MKKKTLDMAVRKLRKFFDLYTADLTPAELKALLDEGAELNTGYYGRSYWKETVEREIAKGIGGRHTVYFHSVPKHLGVDIKGPRTPFKK